MTATVTFNPVLTTNALGSFSATSGGLVQGTAYDDPSTRYRLRGGWLNTTETLPMWGGVAISEGVPSPLADSIGGTQNPGIALGPSITRATSIGAPTSGQQAVGQITGFSVFDQNYSAVQSPQSPVPLVGSGMTLNYYPLGSNARIAVACSGLLSNIETYQNNSLVSWDFSAQQLIPYAAAYVSVTVTGLTWATTSGGQYSFAYTGTDISSELTAGTVIEVSGVVSTFAIVPNGQWTVVSATSSHIVVTAAGSANAGSYTSGGTVAAGGGAVGQAVTGGAILPVRVLEVQIGNSMTVSYATGTGFATWNRAGNCAVIQI
jgi:hypothetical protein